jgi:glycosyltransferase involved in cell wall biosynthesis
VDAGRIVSIQTTDERGGAEYANVDLLRGLQSRGHGVVLLTNLPEIGASAGVRVRRIELGPKLSGRTVWQVVATSPRTLWRLARALRAERPVAVTLLHFKKEQLLCALLPRRLTGTVAWAEWGPVPRQFRGRIAGRLYALAAGRADRILAVSAGTARSIIETGVPSERVTVVPNLMDIERLTFDGAARERLRSEWQAGPDTFVVGCLSRFQRRKRIDVAIDAMAELNGDVLLVVAGEGETESELRRRAEPFGDRIRFAISPRGRVNEFLSACDALAFTPSPTEGAPRVITEAQLVGIPVIAIAEPGAVDLIRPGEGTVVSPANDAHATALALAAYRDDPERRRREASSARSHALALHSPARLLATVENLLGLA